MIRLRAIFPSALVMTALAACAVTPPAPEDGAVIASIAPARRDADLVISNVRIVTAAGVIERGSVVIRGERIDRVTEEAVTGPAVQIIDGSGQTLLPGFVDTHVHLITGPRPRGIECDQVPEHLQEDLGRMQDAGFTTIMSTGDPESILRVKSALRASSLFGPDLLVTGPVFAAPGHPGGQREGFCHGQYAVVDAASARADITRLAAEGVDAIKVVHDSRWPPKLELDVLKAIVAQAHALAVPVIAHVQTTEDAREALSLGVDRLVHLPHLGELDPQLLALILERNVPIATTVHLYAPVRRGGAPLNHGEREIPAARLDDVQRHVGEVDERVRQLRAAGVTLAFGSDRYRGEPAFHSSPRHEIETLAQALSPLEVIRTLTVDGARFLGMADDIGAIEVGKRADLVLVRGNAVTDVNALNEVEAVIQRGLVVAGRKRQ